MGATGQGAGAGAEVETGGGLPEGFSLAEGKERAAARGR